MMHIVVVRVLHKRDCDEHRMFLFCGCETGTEDMPAAR
jgi:hypothetical protein